MARSADGSHGAAAGADAEAPRQDPLLAALQMWRAVVAALEQARYGEIGPQYARLSALLSEMRTAELLSQQEERPQWAELARTADAAARLLEPVVAAARQLTALPTAAVVQEAAPTKRAPTKRAATKRAATKRATTKGTATKRTTTKRTTTKRAATERAATKRTSAGSRSRQ